MLTQIVCPHCRASYSAEIHQIIDIGRNPALKQMLLSGQSNLAVCPNCRTPTQVATPLLYHDPEHELFMVYVPMELNMSHVQREQVIGNLVKRAMDSLPPEKRRGYMFQPQSVLTMQGFMEKVLETEGITPEMIARQRRQAELLQTLATADKEVTDILLKERADEIDDTFLAMLRAALEQAGPEGQALKLINLQARLMRETKAGQQWEQRQMALRSFQSEARREGGLSPALLLKHILANKNDEAIVGALISVGRAALSYEFFSLLSAKIARREKSGIATADLEQLREELLAVYEAMQRESEEIVGTYADTVRAIMEAQNKAAAVSAHWNEIDETFVHLLSAQIAQLEEQGQQAEAGRLQEVYDLVMKEMERHAPPELRLLNQLLQANSDGARRRLLEENQHLLTPQLLRVLEAIGGEVAESGADSLLDKLRQVKAMIEARVGRA